MVKYDPTVIHQHAQTLYDRALVIMVVYGVCFGLLGLLGGAALGSVLGDGAAILGFFAAMVFGALGVLVGRARGFELRLQAQMALCQVQIELNGRGRVPPTYIAPAQH